MKDHQEGARIGASGETGDPTRYFTVAHLRAQDAVVQALLAGGVAGLIGPTGSGKSVLAREIAGDLPYEFTTVFVSTPPQKPADLINHLHDALGAAEGAREAKNKADALRMRLTRLAEAGQRVALFVEDVDQCPKPVLDLLLRLQRIGASEAGTVGVASLLIGGPALVSRLENPAADDTGEPTPVEGVSLCAHLRYFTPVECAHYLDKRLAALKEIGDPVLSDAASERILELSHGSPRLLELICGHVALFAEQERRVPVTVEMVDEAAESAALFLKRAAAEADARAMANAPEIVASEDFLVAGFRLHEEEVAPVSTTAAVVEAASALAEERPWRQNEPRRAQRGPRRIRTVKRLDPELLKRRLMVGAAALGAVGLTRFVAPIAVSAWEGRTETVRQIGDGAGAQASSVLSVIQGAGESVSEQAGETYDQASVALVEARLAAETAYEENRGEILNVVDAALVGVVETARTVREDLGAPELVQNAADVVVVNLSESRATLEKGRLIEAAGGEDHQAVRERINRDVARQIALAEQRFDAEQFTRPSGESAYDAYLSALHLDGASAAAADGLDRIVEIYRQRAAVALSRSEFAEYHRLNGIIDRVQARRPI